MALHGPQQHIWCTPSLQYLLQQPGSQLSRNSRMCSSSRLLRTQDMRTARRFFTFADSVHERSAAAVAALSSGAWTGRASPRDGLKIVMLTGVLQLWVQVCRLRAVAGLLASLLPWHAMVCLEFELRLATMLSHCAG